VKQDRVEIEIETTRKIIVNGKWIFVEPVQKEKKESR